MDLEARAERAERERDEARYVAAEMFEAWFAEQMSLDLDRDVLGPVMGRWLDMEAGVSGEEGE